MFTSKSDRLGLGEYGLHQSSKALSKLIIKVAVGRSLTDFIKSVAFPFCSLSGKLWMAICFSLFYLGVREHCGKETFCCIWEHLEKVS